MEIRKWANPTNLQTFMCNRLEKELLQNKGNPTLTKEKLRTEAENRGCDTERMKKEKKK